MEKSMLLFNKIITLSVCDGKHITKGILKG